MLSIQNLHIAFGETDLLEVDSWQILPKQKMALVGPNGCGKTSLLRILMNQELPRSGTITLQNNVEVGYLPQQAVSGSTRTVWEEVKSGMTRLLKMEQRLKELEEAQEQDKLIALLDQYQLAGGYTQEETIGKTLHGLGFAPDDWYRTCDTFSGGWQMRIALAKLLLAEPDLAILDEPTNHLDTPTKDWLAKHLQSVNYAILIVSHDHRFLDQFASHVVEIYNRELHVYKGNYTQFTKNREERLLQAEQAYTKTLAKAKHLQSYIDRFGAKATKAKQAQSRKKQLEKLDLSNEPKRINQHSTLKFHQAEASDYIPFELRAANIGWNAETILFRNVDLALERGMHLAVVGPNGCGKSTLLKTLAGTLNLQGGLRKVGERIRLGIYSQDLAQQLPLDLSPFLYLHERCPWIGETQIRTILGSLGLNSDAHTREMKLLSGGEKARVVLAELSLNQYNVLFLDEPTNHLDAVSAQAVADALNDFEGAVLCISHDGPFIEKMATHVAQCIDDRLVLNEGFAQEYLLCMQSKISNNAQNVAALDYKEQQRIKNQQQRVLREHKEIEQLIDALETAIAQLDEDLFTVGSDLDALQKIQTQKEAKEQALEEAMERWEALEAEIAALDI